MNQSAGHPISSVQKGSIADDLGLRPGDRLLLLDGKPLRDIFDYRWRQLNEKLLLTVGKADGEMIEFDIEKDEEDDLGLEFANPLLDQCAGCRNHCLFCFIDQLPRGLRPSLYFKDDDYRLSFLTGNYVSLTNLPEQEMNRMLAYRLSPVNVSVHTTDEQLRRKMTGNRQAGAILDQLRRIGEAGIAINTQIVLCPDLNDGAALHQTLQDLAGLGPSVQSIAIVPVGLTRYRETNRLYPLRPLTAGEAQAALAEIDGWQAKMLHERQTRLVYAADELYLKAGKPLPPADAYEDFPQLENGVGMAALLLSELETGLREDRELPAVQPGAACPEPPARSAWPSGQAGWANPDYDMPPAVLLATGLAAAPLLQPYLTRLSARFHLPIHLQTVANRFFGETITVAGLLTGQDLLETLPAALQTMPAGYGRTHLVLPDSLLKADEDILLDDCTLQQLADQLDLPVHACPASAAGLLGMLAWLAGPRLPGAGCPERRNDHE